MTEFRQFSLRLELDTYDDFIRIFPGYGVRQFILRAIVKEIIRQAKYGRELNLNDTINQILNSAAVQFRIADSEIGG